MSQKQAKRSAMKSGKNAEAPVKNQKPKKNKQYKKVQKIRAKGQTSTQEVVNSKYSTNKGVNTTTNNIASVATDVVEVAVPINIEAISACSRAFVNYALSKGWSANSQLGANAWYLALVQLNRIFVSYCSGTVDSTMVELPACVVKLGNLLKPKKNLPYYGGRLALSWDGVVPSNDYIYPSGPSTNTVSAQYGNYGPPDPNSNYPTLIAPVTTTDPVVLATALQSMFDYCQSASSQKAFWQNVPATKEYANWANDPSAFAIVLPIDGDVREGAGGFSTVVRSELPCFRPMFAGFALNTSNLVFGRFPGKQYSYSGDVLSNIGMYVTQTVVGPQLKMKRPPTYKAVDFEEICDVLCQYLCQLMERAVNDPINVGGTVNIGNCSLNYYELRYMLRNDLYYMFNRTQPFVSRIYPQETSNLLFNYAPLQAGIGTVATQSSGAQYPSYLIENIRSLTLRMLFNAREEGKNPVIYYPVLVSSSGNRPSWKDYTYPIYENGVVIDNRNVFADPGNFSNPSVLDGKLGNTYVSLTDIEALQLYATGFNKWMNSLSTYSCALAQPSIDAGIISLVTTSLLQASQVETRNVPQTKPTVGDIARKRHRAVMSIPPSWNSLSGLAVTSFDPILEALVPILNAFVLPTSYVNLTGNTDAATHSVQTEQGRTKEMSRITELDQAGQNLTANNIGQRHALFASYMVKARESKESNFDTVFRRAVEAGKGGILGSIIGGIAKSFLPAEAHGIVDTIASFTP